MVGGLPLAVRVARALGAVARPVLAVGPEAGTGFPAVRDRGMGPLAALVDGAAALADLGATGPVLLVACDLPFVTSAILARLARSLEDADVALPVVAGRDQPVVAAYGPAALAAARRLVDGGARALKDLLREVRVRRLDPGEEDGVPDAAFLDVDTPDDLERARSLAGAEGAPHPPIIDMLRSGRTNPGPPIE